MIRETVYREWDGRGRVFVVGRERDFSCIGLRPSATERRCLGLGAPRGRSSRSPGQGSAAGTTDAPGVDVHSIEPCEGGINTASSVPHVPCVVLDLVALEKSKELILKRRDTMVLTLIRDVGAHLIEVGA